MIDKSKELFTEIELVNDKVNFSGTVEGNAPVSIDYTPPLGDNAGYTSLELLLLSLSSCLGTALLTFLRRMNKNIIAFKIGAHGIRKQEHPTSLSQIELDITLNSPDTSPDELNHLIKMAEDKYCPVWAMLKGNVEISTKILILQDEFCAIKFTGNK